jgi:hypothetical protein
VLKHLGLTQFCKKDIDRLLKPHLKEFMKRITNSATEEDDDDIQEESDT